MAKAIALTIVNQVLKNLGDSQITTLAGITGAALMAFDAVNEGIYEIAAEGLFQQLETNTSFTMITTVGSYAKPSTIYAYDRDSFRYNEQFQIDYYAHRKFDREYPSQTNTNIPRLVYEFSGNFNVYPIPPLSENGKVIKYRAWVVPTPLSTASDSGTCWFPEGFDVGLLSDWATKKILHYRHNEEEGIYYSKIWGEERADGMGDQGNINRMKTLYLSHTIEDGNIMVEPMEQRDGGSFVQNSPVTG